MILRIAIAIALSCALSFAAQAQKRRFEPPEKYSGNPVPSPRPSPRTDGALVHSAWTKFCGNDKNDPQPKTICLTVKEARLETGEFIAGAALIEKDDDQTILRVTLPTGMLLSPGVRLFIDGDAPRTGPYVI